MPKAVKSGSKATRDRPEKPKNSFGVAVKKARRIRHLMLKELAERVGCSPSAISKIENDKATPSLAMVYRICKALRMNVATLLEDQSARRPVVTKAGQHPLFHTAGMQWSRLLSPSADRRMGASIVEIAPGASSDGPLAHDSGEVLGLVLEGKLKLNSRRQNLQRGTGGFVHLSVRPATYIRQLERTRDPRPVGPGAACRLLVAESGTTVN